MTTYDFIVYGNNVGALFSALELGKKHKVALVNPTPNWGAHFAGIKIDAINYDIGMNFFEFTTFHQKSDDLLTYNPDVRNDSARFFHLVKDYFEKRMHLVNVPTPQCYLDGLYGDDIIISNELNILKALSDPLKSKIKQELLEIVNAEQNMLHASNKKKNEQLFLNTNYAKVSIANHGQTFHELFVEPICRKIFNISTDMVPSLFHRIAWAPLFYPETLLQAFEDGECTMPATFFDYPVEGYFARSVDVILNEIKENRNITIVSEKIDRISTGENYLLHFGENKICANHLVWCGDLQSLLSLTGNYKTITNFTKASIALVFLNVNKRLIKKKFSSLYICDKDEQIYRITNQDYSASNNNETERLVFEYNNDLLIEQGISDEQRLIDNVQQFLKKAEIICDNIPDDQFTVKIFKNAVNLPILENYCNFQSLHTSVLEKLNNIELVGMAAGFTATSFNDQIVQGMKLGKKYN